MLRVLEGGKDADVAKLDFSKAFDRVDHGLLLCKLKALGIKGRLVKWIESFLLGRRQRVLVDGHASDWSEMKSGVPQGTVLGPVLFLTYVCDIEAGIESVVSCFADATRVMRAVSEPNDVMKLQEDLVKIYSWDQDNNMSFNDDKLKVLQYGNSRGCCCCLAPPALSWSAEATSASALRQTPVYLSVGFP